MKKLKKIIFSLLLIATHASFASDEAQTQVKNSFDYWAIGVGIPTFVSAKIGHREQNNHNGFEYGIGITPLVFVNEIHAFTTYLFYPKPNIESESYIGIGLKGGGLFSQHKAKFGYIAPGLILGKEYINPKKTRKFVQVAVSPYLLSTHESGFYTSINLTCGFGF